MVTLQKRKYWMLSNSMIIIHMLIVMQCVQLSLADISIGLGISNFKGNDIIWPWNNYTNPVIIDLSNRKPETPINSQLDKIPEVDTAQRTVEVIMSPMLIKPNIINIGTASPRYSVSQQPAYTCCCYCSYQPNYCQQDDQQTCPTCPPCFGGSTRLWSGFDARPQRKMSEYHPFLTWRHKYPNY